MTLNCKPGDLAVVIRGNPESNLGKVVQVVDVNAFWTVHFGEWMWNVADDDISFSDVCLRPIRDQPGADETLTWAGLPKPISQPEPATA